jgi:thiaminase/transcriptional activator TenA
MNCFSEEAWQRTTSLREAIHTLPFNTELAAGSLSRDRFQTYIIQDAIYLGRFSRALGAIAVEQALHARYLQDFGVDPGSVADAEPSPDCLAYTSYLIAAAYHDPWEVLVSALLPCFWLYWDVGRAISRRSAPQNPYRAWIDTYADERFGEAVRAVISITDRAADATASAIRAKMLAAFTRACQYEWLFWDGAYQRRGWPSIG